MSGPAAARPRHPDPDVIRPPAVRPRPAAPDDRSTPPPRPAPGRPMNLYVASAFHPDTNSGAAGSLDAIGRAWATGGHAVRWGWREIPPGGRVADELYRVPLALRG